MALRELSSALCRLTATPSRSATVVLIQHGRRYASAEASTTELPSEDIQDLESQTSFTSTEYPAEKIQAYNPVKRAQSRRRQLPASRYQYRSPRYYRGPLHPHQPPPTSDPSSRQFVPGPFYHTRLEQTYQSTVASDLMTMAYVHKPPGTIEPEKAPRLREWDGSSPYHKNRPKRGPRGPGGTLQLIERDIHWRNVPKIERVTVHSMVKGAIQDSAHLHVAGILLQSITGVRPTVHRARKNVVQFGLRERMPVSLTCDLRGNQAYEFIDKCVHLVFPRIKDWRGIKGSSGDNNGNISFGFDNESTVLFPEVQVNYDMYPPKMIPGFHVTVHTSATSDRHARLLLSAIGVPFDGEYVN